LISVREIDAGGFQRDDGRGHRGEGFAADTASQTGVNNSSVNRAISRAKAIPGDIRADQSSRGERFGGSDQSISISP
jgi:hypothetical protein